MSEERSQHVFISYVREDSDRVDLLCDVLRASGIPYWRDRKDLAPGDNWKAKIRDAIQNGSLIFLACFSERSDAKPKSTMNEELQLAVEEFRKITPGITWLIPVRFSDVRLPEVELTPTLTLSGLQYIDLFGAQYAAQVGALVSTIGRVMGSARPDPETTLAAVGEAIGAERAATLRRLTKEMLPDPARRIALDDLIAQEVAGILKSLNDASNFPNQLEGPDDEQLAVLVNTAEKQWSLVEPFCHSLYVAARWSTVEQLGPWIRGIKALALHAVKQVDGYKVFRDLRHTALLSSVVVAALACSANGRWDNFKALLADQTVKDMFGRGEILDLIGVTSFYSPLQDSAVAASALARRAEKKEAVEDAIRHYSARGAGKKYTPVADWLFEVIHPIFADQYPDEDAYYDEFERAVIVLGLVERDQAAARYADKPDLTWLVRTQWFGRSTRSQNARFHSPVKDVAAELESQQESWGPLRAGLFGASVQRAKTAIEAYSGEYDHVAQRQMF